MPKFEALLMPNTQQILKFLFQLLQGNHCVIEIQKDSYFFTIIRKYETIQTWFTIAACGDIKFLKF
jgi:hypothetical protein